MWILDEALLKENDSVSVSRKGWSLNRLTGVLPNKYLVSRATPNERGDTSIINWLVNGP